MSIVVPVRSVGVIPLTPTTKNMKIQGIQERRNSGSDGSAFCRIVASVYFIVGICLVVG
ncbi:MAG: hypothetical protein U0264_04705 [Candidatus Kapaibacterium sp.]